MIKLVFLENFAQFTDLCKSGFNAKKDSNLMPVFNSIRRLIYTVCSHLKVVGFPECCSVQSNTQAGHFSEIFQHLTAFHFERKCSLLQ